MHRHHIRKRVVCAAAALLLTGVSFNVFVSAEPRPLEDRAASVRAALDPAVVKRGRYLVKTTGCNDCHTPGYGMSNGQVEESRWLIGDQLGWEGPWGVTYPTNLRLFMQYISQEQWLHIARQPARPPMPWFSLREMTDEDLIAIYQYVRSLGAAGTAAPDYVPPGQMARTPVVKFPAG
jgi:mono/diheme cytochrome c family protein